MSAKSVLFIGGTGKISSACVRRAVEAGLDVTVFNRGRTAIRPLPDGVRVISGDAGDAGSLRADLGNRDFDAVLNFIVKVPGHARSEVEMFGNRTGQYVFISSATVYEKPVRHLPITESTPLGNPFSEYARNKIACEAVLMKAYQETGFPVTIVRPSSTYDRTALPFEGGWTVVDRMRRGLPVVVHGDGTSLWVLTHHDDFARAFVPVLTRPEAIGEAYHITSDEVLTWNAIYETVAEAAGAEASLVHVASESIAKVIPEWSPRLLGDKAHSLMFDNSKVRGLATDWVPTVPFTQGAAEMIEWFDSESSRQEIDQRANAAFEALTS